MFIMEGSIRKISYSSKMYAFDNMSVTKPALVYLPAGYDNDDTREYRTLYLMHGGGGNEEEFLYGQDRSEILIKLFDKLIGTGKMEPVIVVTPTFYYSEAESKEHSIPDASLLTKTFPTEFRNELLPMVENLFRVKKGRENRAFGGFSMGAETTWQMLLACLDLVEKYIPLSGDCWVCGMKGGLTEPEETVRVMEERLSSFDRETLKYDIIAHTGDKDIAYPAMEAMIKVMMERGWNGNGDKLEYAATPSGNHWYPDIYKYLEDILPRLFS